MVDITVPSTEFATATGANVFHTSQSSLFDHPPSGTTDLVVSSLPGDATPYTFSVGDTYALAWVGPGGANSIASATIPRSDALPGGGHAVVFGGQDANGQTVHLVWSPNFDLNSWYWSHYAESNPPGFWVVDRDPNSAYSAPCSVAGTRIGTPRGCRAVETLRPGDLVDTVDHGPQPVLWSGMRRVAGSGANLPVVFARGRLGNTRPLAVLPRHRVLVASARADLLFGAAEVLVPAAAFHGRPGVTRRPSPQVTYVHLVCARHELILAEGAASETLLLGPAGIAAAEGPARAGDLHRLAVRGVSRHAARPVLRMAEARMLLESENGGAREEEAPPFRATYDPEGGGSGRRCPSGHPAGAAPVPWSRPEAVACRLP